MAPCTYHGISCRLPWGMHIVAQPPCWGRPPRGTPGHNLLVWSKVISTTAMGGRGRAGPHRGTEGPAAKQHDGCMRELIVSSVSRLAATQQQQGAVTKRLSDRVCVGAIGIERNGISRSNFRSVCLWSIRTPPQATRGDPAGTKGPRTGATPCRSPPLTAAATGGEGTTGTAWARAAP